MELRCVNVMKKYEKKVWIKVLELYKDYPHLWDKKNINYLNKSMRQDSFQVLLDVYKEIDDEATVECLKAKIMNMRTCFLRELKKVKATSETGSGPQYVPTLWYYDWMMFLSEAPNGDPLRRSSDAFIETVYKEEFSISESEESEDTSFVPRKKLRPSIINEESEIINSTKELSNNKDDKWDMLSKFIAVQLQDIEDRQFTIVNKLISDVIFYAKTGKLTVDSSINLGSG